MNNTTHDRVIALIADSGLSQADFARHCDLSVTNFNRFCNKKIDWTERVLSKIAHSCHVSYRWLKDGVGEMFEEPQGGGADYLDDKGLDKLIDDARAKTIMQQLGGHHNSQTAESAKGDRQAEIDLLKKMVEDKDKEIEFLRQMLSKMKG